MTEAERLRLFALARDALLREFPDAWALYDYGSLARGDDWPASDIDLAVLLPAEQYIHDILGVSSRLSENLGRNVDLVDLRRVSDVLRREILADGVTVFARNPELVLSWEASAMSRYARYREEVKDILEQFKRTGIGYSA